MAPRHRRLVVCLPSDELRMRLAPCHPVDLEWVHGGVRTLHELAFAAAAAGHQVELRGWIERSVFAALAECCSAVPDQPSEARAPGPEDVIVMPVGHTDPLAYVGPWLSESQLVLAALSPLGMLGWPFVGGWQPSSHLTLSAAEVNRPEHFAAMTGMSIAVWTNAELTASAARAVGVHTAYLGQGSPLSFPLPARRRSVDVVWLQNNRWSSLADPLAAALTASVAAIGTVSHREMLQRLGEAKVLLYPGQVEGSGRLTHEARAMGAVPVVVRNGNPWATDLTEEHGVVSAESLEDIPATIAELLAQPVRWASLSARAMSTARAQVAWEPFVARVREAMDTLPGWDPSREARGDFGARLREQLGVMVPALGEARHRVAELEAELPRVRARNEELEMELARVALRKDAAETEVLRIRGDLESVRGRRAVRWSTRSIDVVRSLGRRL